MTQQIISRIIVPVVVLAVGVLPVATKSAKGKPSTAKKVPQRKPQVANKPAANTARGVVKDARAKPIADVTVDIAGTVSANGGIVSFEPTTNANGIYKQVGMPPGTYTAVAWKIIRYNDRTYRVPMSPVKGKIEDEFLSKNGITRDFTWKISGPLPSKFFEPDEPNAYYGGSLKVYGTDENGLNRLTLPEGTKLTGTLVPDGPLMDGTTGKTISFEVPFKQGLYLAIHKDIPIGRYTFALSAALPTGETQAIRLYDGSGHEDSDFKPTATIEFLPSTTSVRPYQAHFVQQAGVYVKL